MSAASSLKGWISYAKKSLWYAGQAASQAVAFGVLHGTALHWTQLGLLVLGGWGIWQLENGPKPGAAA